MRLRVALFATGLLLESTLGAQPAAPSDVPSASTEPPLEGGAESEDVPTEELVIEARSAPKATNPQSTRVSGEGARTQAGTMGDAVQAAQNFAGVARSPLGNGELIVWGAAPSESASYVDGVEVPSLFHLGGVRSIVPSPLVRSLELVPGGFGSSFGRAIGGLAMVETKSLPDDGWHGHVSADFYDATAMVTAAPSDAVRFGLAVRASYVDALFAAVVDEDIGDHYALPRYQDGYAKVSFPLGDGEDLSVWFLHRSDQLERARPSADPALRRSDRREIWSERVSLRYRAANEASSTSVQTWLGFDDARRTLRFAEVPAATLARSTSAGLRAEHQRDLFDEEVAGAPLQLRAAVGLDALARRTRHERSGSFTLPAREGDVQVFGQPPGGELSRDDWTTGLVDPAPYAFITGRWGPVTLTPGLRVNATMTETSRTTPRIGATPEIGGTRFDPTIDPRADLAIDFSEGGTFSAACGLHHQTPAGEDRSAVFGSPELEPLEALHLVAGHRVVIREGLAARVTGYYKSLSSLPVRASGEPRLAEALVSRGHGEASGMNLTVSQERIYGFAGTISYALSRSVRDAPGMDEGVFDFDQTHVLNVLLNQSIEGFDFGLRFRVASGTPRTPIVGAYYNAKDDRYEPVFGERNTTRLPTFYQLDLRAEKEFSFDAWLLRVFVDVQNVTNAENVEDLAYEYDYSGETPITGLPIFGVVGAAVEF